MEKQLPTDRLWTVEETSYFLGVPVPTLYHWRWRGEGPEACKIGRHVRYCPDDVHAWVAANRGRVA